MGRQRGFLEWEWSGGEEGDGALAEPELPANPAALWRACLPQISHGVKGQTRASRRQKKGVREDLEALQLAADLGQIGLDRLHLRFRGGREASLQAARLA